MLSTSLRLPLEIIHGIVLCAIQEDKVAAVLLATVCKAFNSWITPILYSTVVLQKSSQLLAFEQALCSPSGNNDPSSCTEAGTSRKLGSYVTHLWLGPTSSKHVKAHFTQLGRLYNALEDRSHDPDDAQGIGEAWPSAVEVLAQCASLHTLALIDCPLPVAQVLFRRLPDGLDSLSALLLHDEPGNYYFELPDISRLASLRNITFLRTSLTEDTMRRLSQTASITYMGVYPNRGGRYSPYTWLLLHSGIVHLRLFGRVDPEPQPANLVFLDCVDVMINSDMALGQYIEGKLPIPLAELQHRGLSISIMDTRDDSGQIDALGTLYDNWIAALGPAAGCVQLRDAHPRWTMPADWQPLH